MLIALDTETTGLDWVHGCRPFYVSTCDDQGTIRAWEWEVDPLTRTPVIPKGDVKEIRTLLGLESRHKAGRRKKRLCLHNTKFDLRMLELIGVPNPDWSTVDDTVVASHCLASAESHKLKDLALQYLDIPDDDESELKEAVNKARGIARRKYKDWRIAQVGDPHFPALKRAPKAGWAVMDYWLPRAIAKAEKYPIAYLPDGTIDKARSHKFWWVLREYANLDAERTLGLWLVFKDALEAEGLVDQYKTRLGLLPITYGMEARGVTLSRNRVDVATSKFQAEAKTADLVACRLADNKVDNLNSNKQLQGVLYGHFGIKPIKATKTGYATDQDTLRALQNTLRPVSRPSKFINNLIRSRQLTKAVDYLDSYKRFSIPLTAEELGQQPCPGWESDWLRIHPNFNITGTATTRFSSDNPNQQNVSKDDKLKVEGVKSLREVFGPLPGREWWTIDYSNIELRIFAYASGDKELIKAFESGSSVHLIICEALHPQLFAQCEKDGVSFKDQYETTWYQWAKNGTFALIYGASPRKANATYRVADGYERIRKRLPLIDEFIQKRNAEARKYGFVTTLGGYRLQVPKNEPHKAANYFVQGSAGWAMVLAMLRVEAYLRNVGPDYFINMTIHDELDFDFPVAKKNPYVIKYVTRLMEQSGDDLGIPTPVDVKRITSTWADGERFKIAA